MTDDIVIKEEFELKDIAKEIKGDVFDELNISVSVRTKIRKRKRSAIQIECPKEFKDQVYQIARRYVGMVYSLSSHQYQINFIPEIIEK